MMGKDFDNPWGLKTPKGTIKKMSSLLDAAVFPGTQGGPLEHVIAAKAVAFGQALSPDFEDYGKRVIANAQALSNHLVKLGYGIISGGTDNHLMLIDLRAKDPELTGKVAEETLGKCHITINKNTVPFEERSPFVTSGIRLGTPALTTRGFAEHHMITVAELIDKALVNRDNPSTLSEVAKSVEELTEGMPLFA